MNGPSRRRRVRCRWWFLAGCVYVAATVSASPLPDAVTIDGVEFVQIPAGWYYQRGGVAQPASGESPRHVRIWLDAFYIARHEATATELAAYLEALEPAASDAFAKSDMLCGIRRDAGGRFRAEGQRYPATGLSWEDAYEFARWRGFRLPTELEWEKAARGTDRRRWPWGDAYPDDTRANYWRGGLRCYLSPVDRYPKGASPYGLMGMAGGVAEFVLDWVSEERDRSLRDGMRNPPPADHGTLETGMESPYRMAKGGCWKSTSLSISIHARAPYPPDVRSRCKGVRFAIDVEAVEAWLARESGEGAF